jgi:hypothetical protein
MTTAVDRLFGGFYNSGSYDAGANPGGMGNGGHVLNLPALLQDVGTVANALNAAVLDAAQVTADKATVAADKAIVVAQAAPVIAAFTTYGMPGRVQIANLNTLALSGFFYSTAAATGRPGGETDGFVYSLSDGATASDGAQIFISKNAANTWTRYRTGGAWQAWTQLTTAATVTDTAFGAANTLASAATTQVGNAGSRLVQITGVTTITSFGSTGAATTNPNYLVSFAGALTLTHNAVSLILPGGKNIVTAAGDVMLVQYLGGTNWQVLTYFRATGQDLFFNPYGAESTLASAATTDLGAAATPLVQITGTTAITALGANANTAAPIYRLRFAGVLTLTHNAVSLILPGGANIATASGDAAVAQYLGGGNWRVLEYVPASGKLLPAALASVATAKAGVNTDQAVTAAGLAGAVQTGCMGYAADSSGAANTMVAALTPAPAALTEGMEVLVKVANTSTGASTLNLNGLGAVSIKRNGADLRPGAQIAGQIYRYTYDGSFWQLGGQMESVIREDTYWTVSGTFISSGSSAFFTLSRTGSGAYSIALNAATPVTDFGVTIFLGTAANGSLQPNEKTKTTGGITLQCRLGSNALDDPTTLTISFWFRP